MVNFETLLEPNSTLKNSDILSYVAVYSFYILVRTKQKMPEFCQIPTNRDIFFSKLLLCTSNFNFEFIVKIKYFMASVVATGQLLIWSWSEKTGWFNLGGIIKENDFWGLTVILLELVHSWTFSWRFILPVSYLLDCLMQKVLDYKTRIISVHLGYWMQSIWYIISK